MIQAMVLFLVAGLAKVGGGYLIWLWLREGKSHWLGGLGAVTLALYGMIATLQSFPSFGRVYTAYGGVFILLSVLNQKVPDRYDWAGAGICLLGVAVMLWVPRN